jgi:hypothetical protein
MAHGTPGQDGRAISPKRLGAAPACLTEGRSRSINDDRSAARVPSERPAAWLLPGGAVHSGVGNRGGRWASTVKAVPSHRFQAGHPLLSFGHRFLTSDGHFVGAGRRRAVPGFLRRSRWRRGGLGGKFLPLGKRRRHRCRGRQGCRDRQAEPRGLHNGGPISSQECGVSGEVQLRGDVGRAICKATTCRRAAGGSPGISSVDGALCAQEERLPAAPRSVTMFRLAKLSGL